MSKFFKLREDGSLMTADFRVSFPKIFEADDNGKFGLAMIFEPDVDFTALEKVIAAKQKEIWPKGVPKGYMHPILNGDECTSEREELKGKIYINGKCGKYRPGIVDAQLNPITDEGEFYPGCWARAVVTIYNWTYLGKCGISVNVRNIQKIRDDQPLISRVAAEHEFGPVEDQSAVDL